MPRVSVIIPTFNRAHSLVQAVESVLNQKFSDFEVIVVDDGSTDNTRDILKGFGDRLRPIFQNNQGVSSARNMGIGRASGDWVAFLDSDDEWDPDYLSWQFERADKHPEVIAHISNAVTVFPDGRKEDHFLGTGLSNKIKGQSCIVLDKPISIVIEYGPWFLQSLMIKRDILLKIKKFNPGFSIMEDFDLIARAALKGPFGICNKVLVRIYRRTEPIENLSRKAISEAYYTREIIGYIFEEIRKNKVLTPEEQKVIDIAEGKNKRALGNLMLKKGRKLEARGHYKEALFLHPSMISLVKYLVSFLPARIGLHFIHKGKYIQP